MLRHRLNSPPSSWYSRKPVIALPSTPKCQSEGGEPFEDLLDRHVDDVLKRPSKIRRTLLGVWSFLKTRMCQFSVINSHLINNCNTPIFTSSHGCESQVKEKLRPHGSFLILDSHCHLWLPRWYVAFFTTAPTIDAFSLLGRCYHLLPCQNHQPP